MAAPKRKPFGQIAVQMGLATQAQVKKALQIQREEDAAGKTHRLLGIILVSEGFLSTSDLIAILKLYQQERRRKLIEVIQKAHTPDLGETQQPF